MELRSARLLCLLLLWVSLARDGPGQTPQPTEPSRLSSQQKRELGQLLSQFGRARNDPKRQAEICDAAMSLGQPAVSAILTVVAQEMSPQLNRYRNRFFKQAVALSKRRTREIDLAEVAQLRSAVLGLSKRPDFTHDSIVRHADPAVKRLEDIFVIRRDEVLAQSKDLQPERDKLKPFGEIWERCAQWLHQRLPPEAEKPKEPPAFEKYLEGEEDLAVGLAVPMDPTTREILAVSARLASRLDPEEARAILALNLTRNLLGLRPVVTDLALVSAARDHSQDMQELKFFSHESPLPGKKTPWDRAERWGTKASAENIYVGAQDGRAASSAWFHSPGHHKNMLGDHRRVGIGRAGGYFTELFGQ